MCLSSSARKHTSSISHLHAYSLWSVAFYSNSFLACKPIGIGDPIMFHYTQSANLPRRRPSSCQWLFWIVYLCCITHAPQHPPLIHHMASFLSFQRWIGWGLLTSSDTYKGPTQYTLPLQIEMGTTPILGAMHPPSKRLRHPKVAIFTNSTSHLRITSSVHIILYRSDVFSR